MKKILTMFSFALLVGCLAPPERPAEMEPKGHLNEGQVSREAVPEAKVPDAGIPGVITALPVMDPPKPKAAEDVRTFTVVVTDVPADELLFALARDAKMNLDIHPSITGSVSINAVDQTLSQILHRISKQVSLRFHTDGPNLVIEPDDPYFQSYRIDYLNVDRKTTSTSATSTLSGGDGGGSAGNDSSSSLSSNSDNAFWATLEKNITKLVADAGGSIVSNRESGVLLVQATSKGHQEVQAFIDQVLASARLQVLIEATIVEVNLSDDFEAGIDWSTVAKASGSDKWSVAQALVGGASPAVPTALVGNRFEAAYRSGNNDRDITAVVSLLDKFGDTQVISSPKIMALNNQPSVLKVVDNIVYFEIKSESIQSGVIGVPPTTITNATKKTVPEGLILIVTPFITSDSEIILNVRPTITEIKRFIDDPTIVGNEVPEVSVREMETVLRIADGQIAVIGGLMKDTTAKNSRGVPGLADVPGVGRLFQYNKRGFGKTELVIFLRPKVINTASLNGDLRDFRSYLPASK